MSNDNEKIVDRIKALLAIADDQRGLPEGEVAARIAEKLMRAHAITQDQLQEKETIVMASYEVGRSNWLRNTLNAVAIFCSCKAWINSGTRRMSLAGHQSDLEICLYLFDLIKLQIERECELYLARIKRKNDFNPFVQEVAPSEEGGKKTSNDFKMSAAAGVADKLRRIKQASQAEDVTGTALVLSRARQVEAWVSSQVKLKNSAGSNYRYNPSGFAAGTNVRLSAGVGSKGTPQGIGIAPKKLNG